MKKNKNKIEKAVSVSIIIAAVLFTAFGTAYAFKQFAGYSKTIGLNGSLSTSAETHYTDYSKTLSLNWGISLPAEAHYSEIYGKKSDTGFHGDGVRYHIFSYKEESTVNDMLFWQSEESETEYCDCYSNAVDGWLDKIDVPSEERPNYEKCLYWYKAQEDGSEIIVLCDKNKSVLYIAESFI